MRHVNLEGHGRDLRLSLLAELLVLLFHGFGSLLLSLLVLSLGADSDRL